MFQLNGKTTDKLLKEAYELAKVPDNRELDVLLSSGEQMSISKLCILLKELGYDSISLTGWQAGIYTNKTNQNAVIENIDVSRIQKELSENKIVIIAGFQGINENIDITTLGRGGSDTTAVAIAAALNAKNCYIYSDVDGVYTTDPNKYSGAKKLQNLSYVEMLDIANEGARVLHNRCIELGEKFKIPIITKSTFNNKQGSVIDDKIENKIVKSIVKNDDIMLVNLQNDAYSVESFINVYNTIINNDILPIQVVNNSCATFDVDFLIKCSDINKIEAIFDKKSAVLNGSYDKDNNNYAETFKMPYIKSCVKISRVSVIGYGITNDNQILKKVMDVISKLDVNIYNIDITTAKIIITFSEAVDDGVIELIHNKLF